MPKLTVALPEVLVRIRNSCESFFKENFNTNSLKLAIFFSLPVYINFFLLEYEVSVNFPLKILFFLIMCAAFYSIFYLKHKWFGSGFFIGLFWFWWIGLSFRYYGLSFLVPFVSLGIAVFYGILFWLIGKAYNLFDKVNFGEVFLILFFAFGFDYVSPFTFDWLKPEILLANTFVSPTKPVLVLLLASAAFVKKYRLISVVLLFAAFIFSPKEYVKMPEMDFYVASTDIPQDKKWDESYIPYEIKQNFHIINKAINLKKDVVVLPESAFPLFLNMYDDLMDRLKKLSNKITIVTGALHLKNGKYYNATYVFENGDVKILDKHILVPFGEYIPLPFFQKEINELFFGGASDYATSEKFGIFKIKNELFINAICYEATVEGLYKLKPNYVVALSNDAWFMPSIMPSLQQMLIKVYSKKYKKTVYHSINGFRSYIIGYEE